MVLDLNITTSKINVEPIIFYVCNLCLIALFKLAAVLNVFRYIDAEYSNNVHAISIFSFMTVFMPDW